MGCSNLHAMGNSAQARCIGSCRSDGNILVQPVVEAEFADVYSTHGNENWISLPTSLPTPAASHPPKPFNGTRHVQQELKRIHKSEPKNPPHQIAKIVLAKYFAAATAPVMPYKTATISPLVFGRHKQHHFVTLSETVYFCNPVCSQISYSQG